MFRILTALLLACLLGTAHADQRVETKQQLEAARKDIAELKKLLEQLQQEKSSVQTQLKRSETEMGNLQKQVNDLNKQLEESEAELKRLDGEKKKLQQSRVDQQKLIGTQARAAYKSGGRQEYLKMLLNQQNPEQFSRTLTYYDYLSKARFEQINTFNETIRQLGQVESDIDTQRTRLNEQKDMLDSRHAELARVHEERKQALSKLNTDLAARDKRLKARQDEQAQLNQVLKTIEETLARQAREAEQARQRAVAEAQRLQQQRESRGQASAPSASKLPVQGPMVSSAGSYGGPFASARGKLPWPVDGRLIARFGSQRGDDPRSKWDGVMISASEGSTVRAVHGGRVVFADWLRGAGLLVILDHGNGYLSLYGHNQRLLKNAGDVVKAGESIATVGNSGGQERSALYFAIRQQGRPSDPIQWCRAQG
jgi:septal ring factor EnvC (AmiA/AmiB activator)